MLIAISELVEKALDFGFTHVGVMSVEKLEFMPEVLDMCTPEGCESYGTNWCCPPAMGDVRKSAEKVRKYEKGIIVQTVGEIEDSFDFETMWDVYRKHEERFGKFLNELRETDTDILPLGADTCSLCEKCTYPDSPCRFPDKAVSPIEAYGLVVSRVCELSGMKYYYGNNTITYTSCIMFN